ncbi:hypothetical protein [Myxococcus dinghuensis]|nr:hypothetical protein [Myxococcus dinghuensis]
MDIQVAGGGDARMMRVAFGASRDDANGITRTGAIGGYTGR